jgi:hypothetical protein
MPWQLLANKAEVLAIHAAYMGFGKILYFGGDQHDPTHNLIHSFDATRLFDCSSGSVASVPSPHFDAFCSGHAFLGASNIVKLLVAGGTEQFDETAAGLHHEHFTGLKSASVFNSPDFITPTGGWNWTPVSDMTPGLLASTTVVAKPDPRLTGGRWYPTLITLPTGEVIAFSGHPESSDGSNSPGAQHNNCIPEIFTPDNSRGKWRQLALYSNNADRDYYQSYTMTLYPRMHLLPSGTSYAQIQSVSGLLVSRPTSALMVEPFTISVGSLLVRSTPLLCISAPRFSSRSVTMMVSWPEFWSAVALLTLHIFLT